MSEGNTIEPGLGRGSVPRSDADMHAIKTPTVRNALRTMLYDHHGAFRALQRVVNFYDRRGGRGISLSVSDDDPDVPKFDLFSNEKASRLKFLGMNLLDATLPEKFVLKPNDREVAQDRDGWF